MSHPRGECEAIRLLRKVLDQEQTGREWEDAMAAGRDFLQRLNGPAFCGRTRGCKISREELREIARLDGLHWTQQAIADRLGIKRASICYHLKPSGPMLDALLTRPHPRKVAA